MNIETVIRYLTMAVVVVTALPVHELAHGLVADRLGDHTAREQGRLTLNPFAHLDLFGTLALLLFGFGWAKPVPVNPSHFKKPKRDMALTALAGPLSNILLALILMVVFKVYMFYGNMNSTAGLMFGQIIYTILWTNLTLAVFNLLPVPPLDGFGIITQIFRLDRYSWYYPLYRNGFYILMVLIIFNVTSRILTPAVLFFADLLL